MTAERTLKCRFCDFVIVFRAKRASAETFHRLGDHIARKHPDEAERMDTDHEEANELMRLVTAGRRRDVRPFNRRKRETDTFKRSES